MPAKRKKGILARAKAAYDSATAPVKPKGRATINRRSQAQLRELEREQRGTPKKR